MLQTALAFTWAGLVIGLSFIETPLKFEAPGITPVLAVGIGRLVFGMLNRIEMVLAAVLAVLLWKGERDRGRLFVSGAVLSIVALQTVWLLPLLDARAVQFIGGNPPAPSVHHWVFIGLELAKVAALLMLGAVAARGGDRGNGEIS